MFGLSLGKLIVLVAVVLVVWFGFKYVSRVEEVRRTLRRAAAEKTAPPTRPARPAQDLVKCQGCGAYVAAGGSPCARADCPWR